MFSRQKRSASPYHKAGSGRFQRMIRGRLTELRGVRGPLATRRARPSVPLSEPVVWGPAGDGCHGCHSCHSCQRRFALCRPEQSGVALILPTTLRHIPATSTGGAGRLGCVTSWVNESLWIFASASVLGAASVIFSHCVRRGHRQRGENGSRRSNGGCGVCRSASWWL